MIISITEALAELKLIGKKLDKKRSIVLNNLVRYDHVVDPLASEGGSGKHIPEIVQSIFDLETRFVKIRGAIAQANMENEISLTFDGHNVAISKTIYDWLTWRRDISEKRKLFLSSVHTKIKKHIDADGVQPKVFKQDEQVHIAKLIPNVDMGKFLRKDMELTEILEQLDGKLSLKNATIQIEI